MALEHLFQGSALNAVDGKGRVSVPAFLRSVIERRGDAKSIVLAKHESFPCLSAYDPAYAALKHSKLERLLEKEETSADAQLEYQQRNLMAFAATRNARPRRADRLPPMMRAKGRSRIALFLARETFRLEPGSFTSRMPHPKGHEGRRPLPARERGLRMTRFYSGPQAPRHGR